MSLDFYIIKERTTKSGAIEVYPDFKVCRSKDLMIRGGAFYAIWDAGSKLWNTDEYRVQQLVDSELYEYADKLRATTRYPIVVMYMSDFSTKSWLHFRTYINCLSDSYTQLDEQVTFLNSEPKKLDFVSKRVPYSLSNQIPVSYQELMSVLYEEEERHKLEWAIGAIFAGEAKNIQKFIVLYGEAGAGKSTILNIIQKLFEGYYTTFEAKAITSSSNTFSTEVFKSNPLVAIQHDGDLSKIEDNSKLNSIVSHEDMTLNEKYKSSYMSKISAFLFMGTNKPVKITDAKSGIIRRLIDVSPSGNKVPETRYEYLISNISYELGDIANYCLEVYKHAGKNYYSSYTPVRMILQTDVFYNFVEANMLLLSDPIGVTLSQAYTLYKTYCDDSLVEYKLARHKFREELKNYYEEFHDLIRIDGKQIRSFYKGFLFRKFINEESDIEKEDSSWLKFKNEISTLDGIYQNVNAQLANQEGTPICKWAEVSTTLADIDTSKLHWVKFPNNHIVIDFDIKNEKGEKDLSLNMKAASLWPETYAEISKGGQGIHLHYQYTDDVEKLARLYDTDIEIKVFVGNASLRRRLTKCVNLPIKQLSGGLPLSATKKMINKNIVQSEHSLRQKIIKNLHKEYHSGTKPSVDFIHKLLNDAYDSKMVYDVSDLTNAVMVFAANSSNQAEYCLKLVNQMKFKSEEKREEVASNKEDDDSDITFFDIEVFKNLLLIMWKDRGVDKKNYLINPSPMEIEPLLSRKLVGFNNRGYDNHIMYAAYLGYNNAQIYELSQKIIANSTNAKFGEAYNLSYTDIYDFASAGNKKRLKKWEIELGIYHKELGIPWDKEVSEEEIEDIIEYCWYDVLATEAVFDHLAGDWAARKILSKLSGLSVNATTNNHSVRIVFGNKKDTSNDLVYTDLRTIFPGYKFEFGKSTYKGEEVNEGGEVYAEPGIYWWLALLDIAAMHPTSMYELNLFGPYTERFDELRKSRLSIKHSDTESLAKYLDGMLIPFVEDILNGIADYTFKDLSNALKTVINSAYGLTFAKFDNPFRDKRNIDNIVAKRGALFMKELRHAVIKRGYQVAHIKTDSIKIPNATDKIIDFVMAFGKRYGYTFEHEDTYEKMCLVNKAVYIAKSTAHNAWEATGAQFAHPYVFKTLFSKESLNVEDYAEAKSVKTSMYLDYNENDENEHKYKFIGKDGNFVPIQEGHNAGLLVKKKTNEPDEDRYDAVTGTKGHRWVELEDFKNMNMDSIDLTYHENLIKEAKESIAQFGDLDMFINEVPSKEEIRKREGIQDQEEPCCLPLGSCNSSICLHYNDSTCELNYNILPF